MVEMRMVITMNKDGLVNVECPVLNNKGLCYMMLENARDAIKDFHDAAAKSPIMVAPATALPQGGG